MNLCLEYDCMNKSAPYEDLCKYHVDEQQTIIYEYFDYDIKDFIYIENKINKDKIEESYYSYIKDIIKVENKILKTFNDNIFYKKVEEKYKLYLFRKIDKTGTILNSEIDYNKEIKILYNIDPDIFNSENKTDISNSDHFKKYILENLKQGNKIINDNGKIYIEKKKLIKHKKPINEKSQMGENINSKNINIKYSYNYRNCIMCNNNIFSEYILCDICYKIKLNFNILINKVKNMKYIFYNNNILIYNKLLNAYIKEKIIIKCINYKTFEYKIFINKKIE